MGSWDGLEFGGAPWPRGQCGMRAITEVKQLSFFLCVCAPVENL
jgi:hypothetical protein